MRKAIAGVLLVLSCSLMACNSSSGTSLKEKCEQKWRDNQATASGGYMTHDIYVKNCLQTYKDVQNGDFGNG